MIARVHLPANVGKSPMMETITLRRPWIRIDPAGLDVVNVAPTGMGIGEVVPSIKTIGGDIAFLA